MTKTIKMKQADWAKWDAALRSGLYAQADGVLASHDGKQPTYCCLGLLEQCLDGKVEDVAFIGSDLPSFEWLNAHGIEFSNGLFEPGRDPMLRSDSAAGMNDNGHTFAEIADAIAECVEFTDAVTA